MGSAAANARAGSCRRGQLCTLLHRLAKAGTCCSSQDKYPRLLRAGRKRRRHARSGRCQVLTVTHRCWRPPVPLYLPRIGTCNHHQHKYRHPCLVPASANPLTASHHAAFKCSHSSVLLTDAAHCYGPTNSATCPFSAFFPLFLFSIYFSLIPSKLHHLPPQSAHFVPVTLDACLPSHRLAGSSASIARSAASTPCSHTQLTLSLFWCVAKLRHSSSLPHFFSSYPLTHSSPAALGLSLFVPLQLL